MGTISLSQPQIGQLDATEDPKIINNFTLLQALLNGNLDATNIAATLAQASGVNQAGQTVKGAVNIAASQSTSSATYTTLATPDQVTGIVLPTNGLIAVWYQATWQEASVAHAKAAIFLGSNQLEIGLPSGPNGLQETGTNGSLTNTNYQLASSSSGLASSGGGAYTGDVTTGQIVGTQNVSAVATGGPTYIFAAAGTYTVSVQFRSLGGGVTASNRKLWTQAISFA